MKKQFMKKNNSSIIKGKFKRANRILMATIVSCTLFAMPNASCNVHAVRLMDPDVTVVGPDNPDNVQEVDNSDIKLKLYENYDADYDMYEESMDDMFFFYCNVGNGSFTSDPVSFDFPNNLTYVVEKDGTPYAYQSGKQITDVGNYVIRITANYEGATYYSTFRFSLKEKKVVEEPDVDPNANPDDVIEFTPDDLVIDPNDTVSDEDIQRIIEEAGNNMYTPSPEETININKYSGFETTFNNMTMLYNMRLLSGDVVVSNVPNGAIVNNSVTITVPETLIPTIYKDGEAITTSQSLNFTEPGFYRVVFDSESAAFYRYYTDDNKHPFITFRVLGNATNDIEVFTAPEGCKITSVSTDAGTVKNENGGTDLSLDSYWMEAEGSYSYKVYDPMVDASYRVTIVRDITAPKAKLELSKSAADIILESNDIANVEVYRDGVLQDYSGDKITGKGNYVVNIYDEAGNVKTMKFYLKDAFNIGTFFTILILVAMVISGFVFVRLQRTRVRVR